ncbi:MAG: GNAT family acetyltransferase [Acidimicrobiales bacterium]
MQVEELTSEHREDVIALWGEVGLTRPWNDPGQDYDRALEGPTSAVLGLLEEGRLRGTAMVGHDGHRGWVYYLAVAPAYEGRGLGSLLMDGAERWLRRRGAVKVQVMVRNSNSHVIAFYEKSGYQASDVTVLARRLDGGSP